MLPIVDLSGKSAFQIFFVGDATEVRRRVRPPQWPPRVRGVPSEAALRVRAWGCFCKAFNYWDVFIGNISFYLVLEFVSSFSSRSYPSVRKCTDYCCGMNMSTNMALKTRTRCYSFDQSVRKGNDRLLTFLTKKKNVAIRDI